MKNERVLYALNLAVIVLLLIGSDWTTPFGMAKFILGCAAVVMWIVVLAVTKKRDRDA